MEETRIRESLERFARRHRAVRTARQAVRGAMWGALLGLAAALAAKIYLLPAPDRLVWIAPVLLVPLGAGLLAWVARIPRMRIARAVDRRAALQERVATAFEWIDQQRPQTLMARAQLHDAAEAVAGIRPADAFPFRMPRRVWIAPLAVAASSLLFALPEWHLFPDRLDAMERAALSTTAHALEAKVEALSPPRIPPAAKIPRMDRVKADLQELARDLRAGRLSRREALARVARSREAVRQAQEAARARQEAQARAAAGAKPGRTEPPGRLAGRSEAAAQLQSAATTLQQIAGDLDAAKQTLSGQPQTASAGAGNMPTPGPGAAAVIPVERPGTYQAGKGKGAADYGRGSTHRAREKHDPARRRNYALYRQADRRSAWTGEYRKLYVPERKRVAEANARVSGRRQPGALIASGEEVRGAARPGGAAHRPAGEVYDRYRREAEEAMLRERIPSEYRDVVRGYFEEIKP